MIFRIVTAFLLCFLCAFFTISLVWPDRLRARSLFLRCCLAVGFGLGISSCGFFLWLCLAGAYRANFFTLILPELAITGGLGLGYIRFHRQFIPPEPCDQAHRGGDKEPASRLFAAIFYIVLLCAVLSFILISLKNPHGEYDATSNWNLRARFLARGTVRWRDAFVDDKSHSHAAMDYPLLLPTTIARFWKYVGCEPVWVPIVVAFLFTFSSVGLLCSSLTFLRNKRNGYLGGIVLLSAYSFVDHGAWQYADVVIGWFMLSTIAILAIYDAPPSNESPGLLALVGASAGFCAWSKNEGLLFLLLVLSIRLFSSALCKRWSLFARQATALVSGLLPILAILAYFKLAVAPANSWFTPVSYPPGSPMQYFLEPGTIAQKLTDVSRYQVIAKAMASQIIHFGGNTVGITPLLGLYLIVAKVKRKSAMGVKTGIALLPLMMLGYFVVYLVTPLNLDFHLRTSLARLLLQLWPSTVFVIFMIASSTEHLGFDSRGSG